MTVMVAFMLVAFVALGKKTVPRVFVFFEDRQMVRWEKHPSMTSMISPEAGQTEWSLGT